jgi:hypothetical protein
MGMDILRAISKSVEFSSALTFLPLMIKVTIKRVTVRGALRPEPNVVSGLRLRIVSLKV